MKHAAALVLVGLVAAVLVYLSRFWFLDLWPRAGLFGIAELHPGGGLVGRWVRGSWAAPFELLIWACGVFLLLGALERFLAWLMRGR